MARNKTGMKLVSDFLEMCGVEESHEVQNEAALFAMELSEDIPSTTDGAAGMVLIGLCLLHLGVDRVLVDWGWQDPDDEESVLTLRTRNGLTRTILKTYFERALNDYKKSKARAGNGSSEPNGTSGNDTGTP